jgi:hypothetical protein
MMLLSVPFDACRAHGDRIPWAPTLLALAMAAALAGLALGAETLDLIPPALGRALAAASIHAGFIAIGWILGTGDPSEWGSVWSAAGLLFLASVLARFTAWGGLLYLLVPVVVVRGAIRITALQDIGVTLRAGAASIMLGIAAGAFLGLHLLLSASLTLGYAIRLAGIAPYLSSVCQDMGANALTAEWLFRGALFSRSWRRWDFWPAATVSTLFAVARYLLDPSLPSALEVRAGAVFYMSLVGFTACALRAASASLLPGYLTTATFFLCYRLLAQ